MEYIYLILRLISFCFEIITFFVAGEMNDSIITRLLNGNTLTYKTRQHDETKNSRPPQDKFVAEMDLCFKAVMRADLGHVKIVNPTGAFVENVNRYSTFVVLCSMYAISTKKRLFEHTETTPSNNEVDIFISQASFSQLVKLVQIAEKTLEKCHTLFEQPIQGPIDPDVTSHVSFGVWIATLTCSLQDDADLALACHRIGPDEDKIIGFFEGITTISIKKSPASLTIKSKKKPVTYVSGPLNEQSLKELLDGEAAEAKKKQKQNDTSKKKKKKKNKPKPNERLNERVDEEIQSSCLSWLNDRFQIAANQPDTVFFSI